MRIAALSLISAIVVTVAAASANAAPAVPASASLQVSNIVEVAGGCGRGLHPNRWGRCAPNRYGYYRPHWHGYYGGGYYRSWGSPSDHMANQLNRQELGRMYPGY